MQNAMLSEAAIFAVLPGATQGRPGGLAPVDAGGIGQKGQDWAAVFAELLASESASDAESASEEVDAQAGAETPVAGATPEAGLEEDGGQADSPIGQEFAPPLAPEYTTAAPSAPVVPGPSAEAEPGSPSERLVTNNPLSPEIPDMPDDKPMNESGAGRVSVNPLPGSPAGWVLPATWPNSAPATSIPMATEATTNPEAILRRVRPGAFDLMTSGAVSRPQSPAAANFRATILEHLANRTPGPVGAPTAQATLPVAPLQGGTELLSEAPAGFALPTGETTAPVMPATHASTALPGANGAPLAVSQVAKAETRAAEIGGAAPHEPAEAEAPAPSLSRSAQPSTPATQTAPAITNAIVPVASDAASPPLSASTGVEASMAISEARSTAAPGVHPSFGAAPPASPAMAQQVAAQIAEISRPLPDGPVELSLHPEELGRLKLSFNGSEAGLHIVVSAERPETLEMMRRHIEILAQEMRRLGHEGAQFSFAGGEGAFGQEHPGNGPDSQKVSWSGDGALPAASTQQANGASALRLGTAGLDLRL